MPHIAIHKSTIEDEIEIFQKFLHHEHLPQLRDYILRKYPELIQEEKLEETISTFYRDKNNDIEIILEKNRKIIQDKEDLSFDRLGKIMDYTWSADATYIAKTTILPFSPYMNQIFYYSLLNELSSNNPIHKSLLSVGIHEISHFIFHEYFAQIINDTKLAVVQQKAHIIKEALTTAIMNDSILMNILETEPDKGNPEIQDEYIIVEERHNVHVVKFIQDRLKEKEEKNIPFKEVLLRITEVLNSS